MDLWIAITLFVTTIVSACVCIVILWKLVDDE